LVAELPRKLDSLPQPADFPVHAVQPFAGRNVTYCRGTPERKDML
jgi:hypothetical protein